MPTKTKTATKAVKSSAKKVVAKAKPAVKKAAAKGKKVAKPAAEKASAKPKAAKKKSTSLIQSVKKGVQTGLDAVGDLVKKVTPDALLPKSAKTKRK